MINNELRKSIKRLFEENDLGSPNYFENYAYDNSIIGFTSSGSLVYSYNKMIRELSEEFIENNTSDPQEAELDALEWIEYNTIRSLPYFSGMDKCPIIIYDIQEEVLEKY